LHRCTLLDLYNAGMEGCPVAIHKVTDASPFGENSNVPQGMRCPVTSSKPASSASSEYDADENDTPSVSEYKRLRRVMSMITKFYKDGSDMKKSNWETMSTELAKLEVDKQMCQNQLDALNVPQFRGHPKQKEYKKSLEEELQGLKTQKENLEKKQKDHFDLFQWSKSIVKVCLWLELNLDDYATKKMDLPDKFLQNVKPVPELTPEEIEDFKKGLDEITYNLHESQDFFQASVDGRLNKYHNIEKQLIEAQLEVMKKYPEENPRRQFIQDELQRDLEYVQGNMQETPESIRRKQKMLQSHQEYLQVLKFHREKLHVLPDDGSERKYDSKFDHYRDD